MYKAIHSGIVRSKSGKVHRYRKGDILNVPKNELSGIPSLLWIGEDCERDQLKVGESSIVFPLKYVPKTVTEIKDYLQAMGINFSSKAKKQELLELLKLTKR